MLEEQESASIPNINTLLLYRALANYNCLNPKQRIQYYETIIDRIQEGGNMRNLLELVAFAYSEIASIALYILYDLKLARMSASLAIEYSSKINQKFFLEQVYRNYEVLGDSFCETDFVQSEIAYLTCLKMSDKINASSHYNNNIRLNLNSNI